MHSPTRPGNFILSALTPTEGQELKAACQTLELVAGDVLLEEGQALSHVIFPERGTITTISVFETGQVAEMVATGREGMVSASAILGGVKSHGRSIVQISGSALVMDIRTFQSAQREMPTFAVMLLAYTRQLLNQTMQWVACNSVHSVEERCARWLLMTHDRIGSDNVPLTQDFLAQLLGVSRPAVNTAARTLQRAGLIRCRRGVVSILDRIGLERASCECYAVMSQNFELSSPPLAIDCRIIKPDNGTLLRKRHQGGMAVWGKCSCDA